MPSGGSENPLMACSSNSMSKSHGDNKRQSVGAHGGSKGTNGSFGKAPQIVPLPTGPGSKKQPSKVMRGKLQQTIYTAKVKKVPQNLLVKRNANHLIYEHNSTNKLQNTNASSGVIGSALSKLKNRVRNSSAAPNEN